VIFNEHGGLEVLKYTDIDKPTAGEGQVVIKNEYAGVRCCTCLQATHGHPWSGAFLCELATLTPTDVYGRPRHLCSAVLDQ
jgi:hypothetical protein